MKRVASRSTSASHDLRASSISLVLVVIACAPADVPSSEREPTFAATSELRARLEPIGDPLEAGEAVYRHGIITLELGVAIMAIRDEGEPCELGDDDKRLILFEGPEAFVLLGASSPRVAALLRDSNELRCWPATIIPRWDDAIPSPPLLSASLDPAQPKPEARAMLELAPEHEGVETLGLDFGGRGPRLGVTTTGDARVMDWSGDRSWKRHEVRVWARAGDEGVLLKVEEDGDDCSSDTSECEDERDERWAIHKLWWPYGGALVSASEQSIGVETEALDNDNGGKTIRLDEARESWRLGRRLLHHDHRKTETTRHEVRCTDARKPGREPDCCNRQTVAEETIEAWVLELEGDGSFEATVSRDKNNRVAFDECEP